MENVKDIDGNSYKTVKIGNQIWMAENLKVTRYRNDDEILNITNNDSWGNIGLGGYCDYENNPSNSETYGRLYNWYAVNDESGLAPEGWHVPTIKEFNELEMFLGMSASDTKIMGMTKTRGTNEGSKLASKELWVEGKLIQNDEIGMSGFKALPAGFRVSGWGSYDMGDFAALTYHAYFWTSDNYVDPFIGKDYPDKIRILLDAYSSTVYLYFADMLQGCSVRCIKD